MASWGVVESGLCWISLAVPDNNANADANNAANNTSNNANLHNGGLCCISLAVPDV